MLIFVLLAALIAVVLLLGPRGGGVRSFRPPAEERALIDRAARGDSEAAAELGRRGAAEEAALKARAAADPRAAREYLERKALELKALQWAREGLRENPGKSAEQTAEVRARIERQYADVAKEVDWARGKAGQ